MTALPALPPTLSWFSSQVARGRKGIFAEVITITPEIAQRILEANVDNRKVSSRLVETVKHDIESGHFQCNGETIIISDEGTLNDGQHRLLGIIAAGKAVDCLVCWGPVRKSRFTIDAGAMRSTTSLLSMQSVSNAGVASVVAKNLFAFRKRMTHADQKAGISKSDVVAEYHGQRAIIDTAVARFQGESFVRSTRTTAAVAAAYVIISAAGAPAVDREAFFTKLSEGANLDRGSPILHLRGKLLEQGGDYNSRRTEARLELVLRYWNAWFSNTSHALVRMQGKFPDVVTKS
jgi:hypothetical protein